MNTEPNASEPVLSSSPILVPTENEEILDSVDFHHHLQLMNSTTSVSVPLDYDFPSILLTHFKGIVGELSSLERPKKKGKLQYWIAPFLNRKAGLSSMTPSRNSKAERFNLNIR